MFCGGGAPGLEGGVLEGEPGEPLMLADDRREGGAAGTSGMFV